MRRAVRAAPRARAVLLGPLPGRLEPPDASDPPADAGALGWTITAMRETIEPAAAGRRLGPGARVRGDQRGRLVGHHGRRHPGALPPGHLRRRAGRAGSRPSGRSPKARSAGCGSSGTGWATTRITPTSSSRAEPGLGRHPARRGLDLAIGARARASAPAERGREWEMTRYRAYQAQLAEQPVGETFTQAADFLGLVAEGQPQPRLGGMPRLDGSTRSPSW